MGPKKRKKTKRVMRSKPPLLPSELSIETMYKHNARALANKVLPELTLEGHSTMNSLVGFGGFTLEDLKNKKKLRPRTAATDWTDETVSTRDGYNTEEEYEDFDDEEHE